MQPIPEGSDSVLVEEVESKSRALGLSLLGVGILLEICAGAPFACCGSGQILVEGGQPISGLWVLLFGCPFLLGGLLLLLIAKKVFFHFDFANRMLSVEKNGRLFLRISFEEIVGAVVEEQLDSEDEVVYRVSLQFRSRQPWPITGRTPSLWKNEAEKRARRINTFLQTGVVEESETDRLARVPCPKCGRPLGGRAAVARERVSHTDASAGWIVVCRICGERSVLPSRPD